MVMTVSELTSISSSRFTPKYRFLKTFAILFCCLWLYIPSSGAAATMTCRHLCVAEVFCCLNASKMSTSTCGSRVGITNELSPFWELVSALVLELVLGELALELVLELIWKLVLLSLPLMGTIFLLWTFSKCLRIVHPQ